MPKQTTDQVEHGVVAVAEQLGRMIGTVQAKVEGLKRGRRRPKKPVAPTKAPTKATQRAAAPRSRANVDAPGKRHRKPVPSGHGVKHSDERIAKVKAANQSRHGRHRRG